ncbi:PLP-dependent aminotransferase family protein [Burkholderia oklahomensis]|uniref:aminotransferase-like domain-containing protein n=1 Tax=Burkholderia oklahomensis TaxID=342113 RepID=UPI00016A9F28|nr:PLP-dependent aminotransferase family protein [Burkholderia oklahomensis]AOI46315.1 aminotransferase [Burkholderia oklahomensis C6786]KUY53927.1 aminotransferase [Burkholderia oklahomensis C6786]
MGLSRAAWRVGKAARAEAGGRDRTEESVDTTDLKVDLRIGQMEDQRFPSRRWGDACRRLFAQDGDASFQYAPEAGLPALREALSAFLAARNGRPVPVAELLVIGGASHAIDLMLKLILPARATIAVEDPSYFLALRMFADWDVELLPIPMQEDGLDVERLEQLLRHGRVDMLYSIPVNHNPTGISLSAQKREALRALSARHGVWMLFDEVYQFVGEPMPECMYRHGDERIVSVGSFSKILAPGVRLGWMHASAAVVERLAGSGELLSAGGVSPITARVVADLLARGEQQAILDELNAIGTTRRLALSQALRETLPARVRFREPSGGYFAWLDCPASLDMGELRRRALAAGIAFHTGDVFSCRSAHGNGIRLAFTYYPEDVLLAAGRRLGDLIGHTLG